jgi:chemotaxis response regulator CheB
MCVRSLPEGAFPAHWSPRLNVLMPKRILVVDDSALVRGLVREFIESLPGFEVCGEAADGLEGVEKGLELKPDLIVLDFSMPRIDGLQIDAIPNHMARAAGVSSVVSKTDQLTILADEVQRLTGWVN